MLKYMTTFLAVCIFVGLSNTASAAIHSPDPQYAILKSLDKKNRTIFVRQGVYKLRIGVKIHDSDAKLPGISSLVVGEKIKFKTRKNKRTGQVEISEIWIIRV